MSNPEPTQRSHSGRTAACRQDEALRNSFGLTEREATIAKLICLGYAPAKLAGRLSLSTNTVRSHLKRIFSKTRTHRQADLVRLLLTTVFAEGNEVKPVDELADAGQLATGQLVAGQSRS